MKRRSIALGASVSALLLLPIQGLYISASIFAASAQEVSPQFSQEQLEQLARSITVMVSTKDSYSSGSGVLIRKEGQVYTVLTNQHVLEPGAPYRIQTSDGQTHAAELVTEVDFGQNDLALLQFSSDANYTVASLANLSTVSVGDAVFAAGFPFEAESGQSTGFAFKPGGQISFKLEEQPLQGGYQIGYTSEVEKGMSGGPVLNRQGEVIGINGIYAHPLWGNPYVYADNSRPNDELRGRMRNSSWAVPVEMLALLAPQYVPANLAQSRALTRSSSQALPELASTVDQRAKEISVLITWPTNSGSGVIVAREGNTYYVLTADHVASNAGLTVVTPDAQTHPVDQSTIKRWDGIDLALLQFTSDQDYQVATLGNYPRGLEDQVTFVSGWPERQTSAISNRQLNAGFLLGWGNDTNRARDERSLTRGYELLYTNFTERGISGGPILDTEGRVIGIHAAAEADQGSQSPTVERADQETRYDLGYSLGIPIRTFLTKISQDNIALNLNIEETLPQQLSAQAQDEIVASSIDLQRPEANADEIAWLSYGNKLWRLRRYEDSLEAYEQAYALKQNFFEAWYAHGIALMGLKRYKNAIDSFKTALEYGPSTSDADLAKRQRSQAWRQISDAHFYSGNFEEALQAIQQAIDLTPNDFIIYQWKATILNDLGRHLEALKANDEAIRKNPDYSVVYISSAKTREFMQDYSGAVADVNKAIERQPDFAFALAYRAYLKTLQKNSAGSPRVVSSVETEPSELSLANSAGSENENQQPGISMSNRSGQASVESSQVSYSKAQIIADLKEAERLQPDDASVYAAQGLVYAFIGDRQACTEAFERALKLRPDSADIHAQRGYAYASLGEAEAAIDSYRKAIELAPDLKHVFYVQQGLIRSDKGDYAGAIADYTKALEWRSNHAIAYALRGEAYAALGDRAKFTEDFNTALQLQPDNTWLYTIRGNANFELGDQQAGIADYDKAISQSPPELADVLYFNRADIRYYQQQDYPGAIEDYTKAIKHNPLNAFAYNGRGNAYDAQENYDAAIAEYNEAIRLAPDNAVFYSNRANTRYKQQDYAGAIADYTEALRLNPEDAFAFNGRGNVYFANEEYDKAIAEYNEAIRLAPDNAVFYSNRANTRYKQQDYAGAMTDYTEAIRLDSNNTDLYVKRADTQTLQKNYAEAIADLGEAARLDPENTHLYRIYQGIVRYQQQDYAGAMTDYNEALRLKPDEQSEDALAYNGRGNVYDAQGNYDAAITEYNEAIRLAPETVVFYSNRANTRYKQQDYAGAIEDYNEVIRRVPGSAQSYNARGLAYRDQGDLAAAIADFSKAIELEPENISFYGNRALAYLNQKNYAEVVKDLTEMIRLSPELASTNTAQLYFTRGRAYSLQQDYQKAIQDYSEAIRLNSNYLDAYKARGDAHRSLNEHEAAIADYDRALSYLVFTGIGVLFGDSPNGGLMATQVFANSPASREGVQVGDQILAVNGVSTLDIDTEEELNQLINNQIRNPAISQVILRIKREGGNEFEVNLTKAQVINPAAAEVYNSRGLSRAELGIMDGAIADLQEAARLFQEQDNMEQYQLAQDKIREWQQ